MKQLIVFSLSVLALQVQAFNLTKLDKACIAEAEVVASVQSIAEHSLGSCQVMIDAARIQLYKANKACKLKLIELIKQPIQVGTKDGHDCRYEVGETLSGVISKNSIGQLAKTADLKNDNSSSVVVAPACEAEAQIIAKVSSLRKSLSGCQVSVISETIQFFKSSQVCALEQSEVEKSEIEVGLSGGHDCRYDIGDTISGVLVKKSNGRIILD